MKPTNISGIPVFEALVDGEDCGMIRISFVDEPAVLTAWQKFSETKPQQFAVADTEQRLVNGVVMRADFPIFRRDPSGFEYYIIYRPDTIRQMAEKYLAESRQNNVDMMHDGQEVDGVEMVQFFIKDTGKGINPAGFDDVADGSLFAEFHITDDSVWEKVKDGTFTGFSLEGIFASVPAADQAAIDTIVDELDGRFNEISTNKQLMSKINNLLTRLAAALAQPEAPATEQKMGRVTTDRGVLGWEGEEDLKAGDRVFVIDADGNTAKAEDGEYVTSDNKTIVVADEKVAEIRDPEAEVDSEEADDVRREEEAVKAINTDKGKLMWDNEEEDLKAGDAVYVEGEEGRVPAPDGEYKTEDGKTIVVVDGKVAEIRDPEAEVAPERDEMKEALEAAQAEAATLRAEVEALRAELQQMKAAPAAKPAHEEVKDAQQMARTGNKGLDRIAALMAAK